MPTEIIKELYNKIDNNIASLTKEDLKDIVTFYKRANLKYTVKNWEELKQLVVHITYKLDTYADLNWINTAYITSMKNLFANNNTFNGDISEWNVSHVRTMEGMFAHCSFNGDLSKWNVSRVENMSHMFECCPFTGENGDISNWKVFHVKDMSHMFEICPYCGDISKWDTSNLENTKYMFRSAPYFDCDISNWNIDKVHDSEYMFMDAYSFDCDLSKWYGGNLSISTFKRSNIRWVHLPQEWKDRDLDKNGRVIMK